MVSSLVPLAGVPQLVLHSPRRGSRRKETLHAFLCEDGTIREVGSLHQSNDVLEVRFAGCVTHSQAAPGGEFYLENAVADVAKALQKHPEQYRLPHLCRFLAIDEDSPSESVAIEHKPAPVTLTLPLDVGDSLGGRMQSLTLTASTQDIANLQDFITFLTDLQSEIAEEWEKKNSNRSPYQHYRVTRSFQSGVYGSGTFYDYLREWGDGSSDDKNALVMSLKLLTKLAQGTMRPRTPLMEGWHVLSNRESFNLLYYVSCYRGFYNFLPISSGFHDKEMFGSKLVNFCNEAFGHITLVQSIADRDWKWLRQAALYRVHERLLFAWAFSSEKREDTVVRLLLDQLPYKGFDDYSFPYPFEYEDIDNLTQQVVAEEEKRLRSFVTMLHGTLTVLSQVAQSAFVSKEANLQDADIVTRLQLLLEAFMTPAAARQGIGEQHVVDSTLALTLSHQKEVDTLLEARDERIAELEQQVAGLEQQVKRLQSQIPVGPTVRIKDTHERDIHVHHYFVEINDQGNGVSQPFTVDFVVDDEGTIIPPPEEEEA